MHHHKVCKEFQCIQQLQLHDTAMYLDNMPPSGAAVQNIMNPMIIPKEISRDNITGVLQSTVAGLEQTFAATYQSMLTNLNQSVQMLHTLNALMDEFLKQNLKIQSDVSLDKGKDGEVLFRILITNSCRFPLPQLKLSLQFVRPKVMNPISHAPTIKLHSLHIYTQNKQLHNIQPSFNGPKVFTNNQEASDIAPNTTHIYRFSVALPERAQYEATVTASFPSPGSTKEQIVIHSFLIPFLHQCTRTQAVSSSLHDTRNNIESEMNSFLFRKLFRIPSLASINEHSCFVVVSKDKTLVQLQVLGVSLTNPENIRIILSALTDGPHITQEITGDPQTPIHKFVDNELRYLGSSYDESNTANALHITTGSSLVT